MQCLGFATNLVALSLDATPPVASIGLRVEDELLGVHWIHGHNPYFVNPDGGVVWLEVEQIAPWINNDPGATASATDAILPVGY